MSVVSVSLNISVFNLIQYIYSKKRTTLIVCREITYNILKQLGQQTGFGYLGGNTVL